MWSSRHLIQSFHKRLRVRSVIRLHKLAAIERSALSRRLGSIGLQLQAEVDQRLKIALGL
jgi:mRNA-degrading endonuclease toxin of MazEF toxin-antitoxin module